MVEEVGLTEMLVPEPTDVPPQLPEYHCHEAPLPNEPPDKLNVDELPEQIVAGLALAELAAEEFEFTVTVTSTQAVLLHVPSALT